MSLNKRLCLRSASEKRQSFDERICDDLSEVILQYLPLEDRFRLECVSKQFRRTIFLSQRVLDLNMIDVYDIKEFEYLLKKFPNINEIKGLKGCSFEDNNYNESIEMIIKYCNNLIHFEFDSYWFKQDVLLKFV